MFKAGWLALLTIVPLLTGCQAAGYRFLNLIGLSQKPLVVLHVVEAQAKSEKTVRKILNPFKPYEALQAALGEKVKRKIVPELCFGFQIEPHLVLGAADVAIISPVNYAELSGRERFPVLALPVDRQNRSKRAALLIVPADSPIEKVADLVAKSVAFGPKRHPRTHFAGLALLREHGVQRSDLKLELLPVPGALKHFDDPQALIKSVLADQSQAGFVDIEAWEQLPETNDDATAPSRAALRVIGRTLEIPTRLVIASPGLDPTVRAQVADFLLRVGTENPEALETLRVSAFIKPQLTELAGWVDLVRPSTYGDVEVEQAAHEEPVKPVKPD